MFPPSFFWLLMIANSKEATKRNVLADINGKPWSRSAFRQSLIQEPMQGHQDTAFLPSSWLFYLGQALSI